MNFWCLSEKKMGRLELLYLSSTEQIRGGKSYLLETAMSCLVMGEGEWRERERDQALYSLSYWKPLNSNIQGFLCLENGPETLYALCILGK